MTALGPVAAHTRRSRQFSEGGRPDRPTWAPAPTVTGHDGHPRGGFEWIIGETEEAMGKKKKHEPQAPEFGHIRALDLFAGTGWGVACARLGIFEMGVEIMPEAVAVRERNGMRTIYADVWEGLSADEQERARIYTERAPEVGLLLDMGVPIDEVYDLLISSPPCQTFSMAGSGAGRKALDDVLAAIDAGMHLRPDALHELGEQLDPKTALVLTPLAHVARDTPIYVVFEQVPPVLPVWERCAVEMRKWGYSVWTGNLQAEQYGVPQTRKRAILIARADGKEAKAPTPTHSRYYSRDPRKLDEGVLPWVSMAEALGWGAASYQSNQNTSTTGERYERETTEPAPTLAAGSRSARFLVGNQVPKGNARDDYHARATDAPAQTLTSGMQYGQWSEDGRRVMRSNYSAGGDGTAEERGRTMRPDSEPSLTMTSKGAQWTEAEYSEFAHPIPVEEVLERGDAEQVRTGMGKGMIERHGERPTRDVLDPAFTVLGGNGGNSQPGFGVVGRPAPTVTGGGALTGGAEPFGRHGRAIVEKIAEEWQEEHPATTVAGDSRVWPPGHKVNGDDAARLGDEAARERYGDRAGTRASRVTVAEAAALQSYPDDFAWDAEVPDPRNPARMKPITKTNQFLQVGNAVPPLLAEAILREVLS